VLDDLRFSPFDVARVARRQRCCSTSSRNVTAGALKILFRSEPSRPEMKSASTISDTARAPE
jgi:hypothetical protein